MFFLIYVRYVAGAGSSSTMVRHAPCPMYLLSREVGSHCVCVMFVSHAFSNRFLQTRQTPLASHMVNDKDSPECFTPYVNHTLFVCPNSASTPYKYLGCSIAHS